MCTPSLSIDVVLASGSQHVWLVKRRDTGQLATVGGFVNVGETVEQAVFREVEEETGFHWSSHASYNHRGDFENTEVMQPPVMQLLGVYSDPRRDSRRHTVSVAYSIQLPHDVQLRAGDDAKEILKVALDDILFPGNDEFAFKKKDYKYHYSKDLFSDHGQILKDYKASRDNSSN